MNSTRTILTALLLAIGSSTHAQVPQIIHYQGRISVSGINFDGSGQFKFALVNSAGTTNYWSNDGTAVNAPTATVPLTVTKGLYSVLLGDTNIAGMVAIAPGVFANTDVRLRVWFNDGTTGFQQLTPDQRLAAVGYAMIAATVPDASIGAAHIADGAINTNHLAPGVLSSGGSGTIADGSVTTAKLADDAVTTVKIAAGAVTTAKLAADSVGTTQVANNSITGTKLAADAITTDKIAAGAVGSSDLAATSVNNTHLNLGTLGTSLWQAGGNSGTTPGTHYLGTADNQALEVKVDATRALRLEPNASGAPNVLAGSSKNEIANGVVGATIGGGGAVNHSGAAITNKVQSNFGVISGGGGNGIFNTSEYSTIGGGFLNVVSNNTTYGTIGGGYANGVGTNAATVAGGFLNLASGFESTVAGGEGNVASGTASFVGGGVTNLASGFESTVGGGERNGASGTNAFVGGGYLNGANNLAATIAGGYANLASGVVAFVGGGTTNTATGFEAAVVGGELNAATSTNTIVGGGYKNGATNGFSAVLGGSQNLAGGPAAAVVGGDQNAAYGTISFVGGGYGNIASGYASAIAGGYANGASGDYSFSAGANAAATNYGSFVWSDASAAAAFTSTANNQFNVKASGGTRIFSNSGATTGVQLTAGSGTWSSASDRNLKENIRPLDPREVLNRLAQMPVAEWNYKSQPASIRHVGPMAQDFRAAFGLGDSDRHISTTDADGVALAAIQGLYGLVKEREDRIIELERRLNDLEKRLSSSQR